MNLLNLRYFKKVVETKNITQAAKELFISQPALSKAMKNFEGDLGVPLFYHSGRNIELTVYAEQFYPYVIETLATLDEGLKKLTSVNKIVSSVTLDLSVASVSIPALVKVFSEIHPEIQLNIIQHHADLTDENNVFHINSHPDNKLTNIPLFTESIMLAIPKNSNLANKKKITIDDITNTPLLMLSKSNNLRKTLDDAFEHENINVQIGSTTDDPATLRSLVNQNLGISFFPETSWSYSSEDPFILKKITDFPIERTIYISSTLPIDHPLTKVISNTLKEFYLH